MAIADNVRILYDELNDAQGTDNTKRAKNETSTTKNKILREAWREFSFSMQSWDKENFLL